jgi:hypothetical protein
MQNFVVHKSGNFCLDLGQNKTCTSTHVDDVNNCVKFHSNPNKFKENWCSKSI